MGCAGIASAPDYARRQCYSYQFQEVRKCDIGLFRDDSVICVIFGQFESWNVHVTHSPTHTHTRWGSMSHHLTRARARVCGFYIYIYKHIFFQPPPEMEIWFYRIHIYRRDIPRACRAEEGVRVKERDETKRGAFFFCRMECAAIPRWYL
jgi:hypothetical protein